MKIILYCFSVLILMFSALPVTAVTIFECVDEEGNSTFQDRCPPGTTPANERKIQTGSSSSSSSKSTAGSVSPEDVEITMYSVSGCDSCVILRNVMDEYKAPYTDKNIDSADEVKRELQEKAGGSSTLTVPTIFIGETMIAGFKKGELTAALESAGFQKPVIEEPEPEEPSIEETAFLEPEEEQEPEIIESDEEGFPEEEL